TISFTTSSAGVLVVGDNIQLTFPSDTTVPASITASNIAVNGTAVTGTVSINTSQRTVQFNTPVAIGNSTAVTVVVGANSNVLTNPTTGGSYTLQVKTKNDNQQATSPSYTSSAVGPASQVVLTQSASGSLAAGAPRTLTATV